MIYTLPRPLAHLASMAILASFAVWMLKNFAMAATGSVGLAADAFKSAADMGAAAVALTALSVTSRLADEEDSEGYSKILVFSSAFEGVLLMLALSGTAFLTFLRLTDPQPLQRLGIGLLLSAVTVAVNLATAKALKQAAERHHSITLKYLARRMRVAAWITTALIVGVAITGLTGWQRLDAVIALILAAGMFFYSLELVRRAADSLKEGFIPDWDAAIIEDVIRSQKSRNVRFSLHYMYRSARDNFVSLHIQVPGYWSLRYAHSLAEDIKAEICRRLPEIVVYVHVEPYGAPHLLEDPESFIQLVP